MKRSSSSLNSTSKSVKINSPSNYDADYWGITQINVAKFSYKWTISNYSFLNCEIGQAIESPQFSSDACNEHKWMLKFYPQGQSELFKEHVSIFLSLLTETKGGIKSQFQFCVLDENGKETNVEKLEVLFNKGTAIGRSKFIEINYLTNKMNGLLPDDCLTIICKMCISTNHTSIFNEINAMQLQVSKHTLSNDLELLFENKEFSDVTLNVSGEIFYAHKVIMAARSPLFSDMIKNNMKDKKQCTVDITDVKPEIMKEILRYIYSEKVENLHAMAKDIIPVADKYSLHSLKMMCEKALSETFNVNNVIELLILADLHNTTHLKKQAMIYINSHYKDIIDKPEFKSLETSHPQLIIQTYRMMMSKQKI